MVMQSRATRSYNRLYASLTVYGLIKFGMIGGLLFLCAMGLVGIVCLVIGAGSVLYWSTIALLFIGMLVFAAVTILRTAAVRHRIKLHTQMFTPRNKSVQTAHIISERYNERYGITRTNPTMLQSNHGWELYDLIIDGGSTSQLVSFFPRRFSHTVFAVELQRAVPNLIFDNHIAHGKQFKSYFAGAQRISFEGNFDQLFDSYAPVDYQVDALSFISPEVLYAMVDFTIPADVEFVGGTLICVAPLVSPDMVDTYRLQCQNLYLAVNDNLNTYFDNHLSGQARRTDVHDFSRHLLRNPYADWWFPLTAYGLYIALSLVIMGFALSRGAWTLILTLLGGIVVTVGPAFAVSLGITHYRKQENKKRIDRLKRPEV